MERENKSPLEIKWIDAKKNKGLEDAYQVRLEVFVAEQKYGLSEGFPS